MGLLTSKLAIIDPLSNDDWFWLSMKDDNHLNRYIQYHLETVEKKLEKWRPLGYQTPTMRREHDGNMGPKTDDQNQISVELDLPPLPLFTYIVQRASNGNLSFRALVEYEDLESAANYLKTLHKQHTDSPSVLRQYNRKASGIRISSIPFDCIDEADRKCYICYQDLSDYEVVSKRRGEAARQEVEYARVKHTSKTFLMPAGTKGTWVRELINYERSESNSDRWDTMITKDLSSFVYGFISAWYRWENIPHEHGCRGPVKLSCGHFFGFDCISEVCKLFNYFYSLPYSVPVQSCISTRFSYDAFSYLTCLPC